MDPGLRPVRPSLPEHGLTLQSSAIYQQMKAALDASQRDGAGLLDQHHFLLQ